MIEHQSPAFDQVWPQAHVVLSVIHVSTVSQALYNIELSRDAGADGVFLIDHDSDDCLLNETVAVARGEHEDYWLGANYLARPQDLPGLIDARLDGVWVDDALIIEGTTCQTHAARLAAAVREANPKALYFGGVAFKYARPVRDVRAVCAAAADVVDVVTTSGDATGHAAPLEKVRQARSGVGTAGRLGLASGVTPDNVRAYLGAVDVFLVATGVSVSFHELDRHKLADLVDQVHEART